MRTLLLQQESKLDLINSLGVSPVLQPVQGLDIEAGLIRTPARGVGPGVSAVLPEATVEVEAEGDTVESAPILEVVATIAIVVTHTVEVVPEVGPGVAGSQDHTLMTATPVAAAVVAEGGAIDTVKAGPDPIAPTVAVPQGMGVDAVDTAERMPTVNFVSLQTQLILFPQKPGTGVVGNVHTLIININVLTIMGF